MERRLPTEKLEHLKQVIKVWLSHRKAQKRDLLSLIGHLAHAAKVVPPGRMFVRRMMDVAHSKKSLYHWGTSTKTSSLTYSGGTCSWIDGMGFLALPHILLKPLLILSCFQTLLEHGGVELSVELSGCNVSGTRCSEPSPLKQTA